MGTFGDSGGGASCGSEAPTLTNPSLTWGSMSSDGLGVVNNASVSGAPEDAAWLVVETESGFKVVSDVVAGHGYAQWEGAFGEAGHATLYDHAHGEVWSSPFR